MPKTKTRRTYRMVVMLQPELVKAFTKRGFRAPQVAYHLLRDFAIANNLMTKDDLQDMTVVRAEKEA